MADLLLCEESPAPEPPMNIGKFKQRDTENEDTELNTIGVETVQEDEILFVRVISKSKPVTSNILNRITWRSHSRSNKAHLYQDPAYTQHPANHVTPTSKALAISPESQSEWLAMNNPILYEPLLIHKPDPVVNSPYVTPKNSSDFLPPWSQDVLRAELYVGSEDKIPGDTNQLSMWNVNSVNIKRTKLSDGIPGRYYSAEASSDISPTMNTSTPSEDVLSFSSHILDEVSFPWTHADDNAHFNFMGSDRANSLERLEKTDFSSQASQNNTVEPKKENLIVLLSDFYYGQHKGDEQPEQKTHTIFKCLSCLKVLKNVKFMNHMKHHLELEKQKSDSWENHTTCQHCHRQFPTPFQLQCHIESVHTTQEPSAVCRICELSFKTDQVLLEHMKDNHKPGEMPYVCQVCNYRSSVFADVETHFRTCHENTKNLLCPFCLKIVKSSVFFVNHYHKHWNLKGVFQCSKCRLQFLTSKAKMEHQTKNHQTFKKSDQLEKLPPETKIIIQASVHLGSREAASISVSSTDPQLSSVNLKVR